MPRKGYKCITVSETVHNEIKKRAQKMQRTISEYIKYLLQRETATKEGK